MNVGEGADEPSLGRVSNQRKRSLAIAWMLAGLAAVFYVITVVKFGEQLDRMHNESRFDLAACLQNAPSLSRELPSLASRAPPASGSTPPEVAPCG